MTSPTDPFRPGPCARCPAQGTVVIGGMRLCSRHGDEERDRQFAAEDLAKKRKPRKR